MKKHYCLTTTACIVLTAGFLHRPAYSQISAVPSAPTGTGGGGVISSSSGPGISTPTTPTVKTPTNQPPVKATPTRPGSVIVRTPVPVVRTPDMNAILRDQAGNVQALKGTKLNGKPEFRPNKGGRKPAVDPRPALQIGRMQSLTVGEIKLRPGGGERIQKYIRKTVTRPIGANDEAPKVKAQETQPIFNLEDSLSESAVADLLNTDTIKETTVEDLRENLGEIEIHDDIEIDFSQNNNSVGDEAEDLIGGVLDLRDRGTWASLERNRQRFDFGFNAGVTGRIEDRIGRGGVLQDTNASSDPLVAWVTTIRADNGTIVYLFAIKGEVNDSERAEMDVAYSHFTFLGKTYRATWDTESSLKAQDADESDKKAWARLLANERLQKEGKKAEEEERQRKEEEEDSENREALGGNDNSDDSGGDERFLDRTKFQGHNPGGGGDTIRMGENSDKGVGPLAKPPTGGNSGSPTIRTDREKIAEGQMNLAKLKAMLQDGTIRFGEDGDPRDNPTPSVGGEGALPINGGNPVVETKSAKAGLNFNGTGNALKIKPGILLKTGSEIQLNVEIDPKGN